MSDHADRFWRDWAAIEYLDALDAGDFDALAAFWERAEADPELEALLREIGEDLEVEGTPGADFLADAARVVDLARRHMPGAFPDDGPAAPLTAADVARRLEAEPEFRRFDAADRGAHSRLLAEAATVPDGLGQSRVDEWLRVLGVAAGPSYRRAFRKVAVLLDMARCQREGRLAAARRANPPKDEKGGRP
jgi:hypothetical protein